jgi:succinate dehydrogenase/fumarate reductase flavoprotein subunit
MDLSSITLVDTLETDVLIVGAGNAGMPAAATATSLGLDFLICDKSGAVQPTRWWVGAVNTRVQEEAGVSIDKKKLLNELTRYASGRCDQSVWNVWIDESAEMFDFIDGIMQGYGYRAFVDTEGYDHATGGTDFYVPMVQHMWYDDHGLEAAGGILSPFATVLATKERNVVLEDYIKSKGKEVLYGYNLVQLIRDEDNSGRVTGAIFEASDGYVRINAAKGILLSTGGYAANVPMMRARQETSLKVVTQLIAMPNDTGEGHKAAVRIGAALDPTSAPMIFDRGQVQPGLDAGYTSDGDAAGFNSSQSTNALGIIGLFLGSQPFMKVNRNGRRFFNESAPYDWASFACLQQPGGVFCMIFDSNLLPDIVRFSLVGCAKLGVAQVAMGEFEKTFEQFFAEGSLVKADTLEELAEKLDLPKKEFLEECERYNTMFDNQEDTDFGKEAYRLSELRKPPYYGCWVGGQLYATIDGIRINADMQALDEKGNVIEGLYAAGDCAGSLYSGNYPEYVIGNAVGKSMTFGRHAVRHIAGDL